MGVFDKFLDIMKLNDDDYDDDEFYDDDFADDNSRRDRILEDLRSRMKFTSQFKNVTDDSFSARRDREINEFMPEHLENDDVKTEHDMAEFVPKPLYTKKMINTTFLGNYLMECSTTL